MATINEAPATSGHRPGVRRMKRNNLRIDMTPMVDLGFLLIAFFVMTSEMTKPRVTKLNMPKEGGDSKLAMSNALTVLLDGAGRVYYYHGDWEQAKAKGAIIKTSLSVKDGLGKVIREKQAGLDLSASKEGRDGLMLLIKASPEARYESIIDALDETLINDVKKYALVKPDAGELLYLKTQP
jgi:biopolymer transport protein ExbD